MDVTVKTTILNKYGFHVRPSTTFSQIAMQYASDIEVEANGNCVDAKSVMGLMTLGAVCGSEIEIRVRGDDAQVAADALKAHVDSSFGGID